MRGDSGIKVNVGWLKKIAQAYSKRFNLILLSREEKLREYTISISKMQ